MKKYLKWKYFIPTIYLLIIIACILFAFVFDTKNANWFLGLFVLTLPWSIPAGFFIMGGLHLGDDNAVIAVFLLLGAINAFLIHWITEELSR